MYLNPPLYSYPYPDNYRAPSFASLTLLRRSGYAKAQSYAKAKGGLISLLMFTSPLGEMGSKSNLLIQPRYLFKSMFNRN